MTDDLVKRLREEATADTSTCSFLTEEAADRIEKLEAQLAQSQLKRWAARWEEQADRIAKLETALREIVDLSKGMSYLLGFTPADIARKALEGKDD